MGYSEGHVCVARVVLFGQRVDARSDSGEFKNFFF